MRGTLFLALREKPRPGTIVSARSGTARSSHSGAWSSTVRPTPTSPGRSSLPVDARASSSPSSCSPATSGRATSLSRTSRRWSTTSTGRFGPTASRRRACLRRASSSHFVQLVTESLNAELMMQLLVATWTSSTRSRSPRRTMSWTRRRSRTSAPWRPSRTRSPSR